MEISCRVYLFIFISLVCDLVQNSESRRLVSQNVKKENFEDFKAIINKKQAGLDKKLHVTCSDCNNNHPNNPTSRKIRHEHHKLRDIDPTNSQAIGSRKTTSGAHLQILFRTYVNGRLHNQWKTSKPHNKKSQAKQSRVEKETKNIGHVFKGVETANSKDHKYNAKNLKNKNEKPNDRPFDIRNLEPYTPYRRLENVNQKLYNKLEGPMRSLLRSMELVLDSIDWRADQVVTTSQFAFDSTRFVMMNGVREQLQIIIDTNNLVYGTVVAVSRQTRDIYKRSHDRQRQSAPLRPIRQYTGEFINVGNTVHGLSREFTKYQELFDDAKMLTMKNQQVIDRVRLVKRNLRESFRSVELRDLIYIANQSRMKLESEFKQSMTIRKYDRYRNGVTDVKFVVTDSKLKLREARNQIRQAVINTRGNLIAAQDRMRKRTVSGIDGGRLAPVSIMVPASKSVFSTQGFTIDQKSELQGLVRQATEHASSLVDISRYAVRVLGPVLQEATTKEVSQGRQPMSSISITRDIIHSIQELYRQLAIISYSIHYEADFIVPCVFRDNPGVDCLGKVDGSGSGLGMHDCEDGSSCGSLEGSGSSLTDGSDPETDLDFEFEGDRISENTDRAYAVIKEFGFHLSKYTSSLKQTSRDVLNQVHNTSETVKEKGSKWTNTKRHLELAATFVKDANKFKTMWHQDAPYLESINKKIVKISAWVNSQFNITQSKSIQTVIKAEKKVKDMQSRNAVSSNVVEGSAGVYDDDDDDDDDEGDGEENGDIVSTVAKVSAVKTEMESLKQLRSTAPTLCTNVQDRIRRIRSDITDLKKKVSRARLILSSLQMSVNISDGSYITSKVGGRSDDLSLTTDIKVCINPTTDNGIILVVEGNNSASYTLEMTDGRLQAVVKDRERNEIAGLMSDGDLPLNTWYSVRFRRIGAKLTMWINTTDGVNRNTTHFTTATDYHQPQPVAVYIGDDPKISYGYFQAKPTPWSGCVSGLTVNGNDVQLFSKSNMDTKPSPCGSNCKPTLERTENIRFEGTGYIEFPATLFYRRASVTSVSIEFRTRQQSSFIMSIFHREEKFHLEVLLTGGAIVIKTRTPTESILLRTQKQFNDNIFHNLKVEYRDSTTYPIVDGEHGLFAIETPLTTHMRRDGILLGGRHRKHGISDQSTHMNLIGCLRNLNINNELISIYQLVDFYDINIGPCLANTLWGNCVEFVESSSSINYEDINDANLVGLTIHHDSKGPLLHYSKSSKFDLFISVYDGTLNITETVADHVAEIQFPLNTTFIPIIIKYMDNTLKITVLEDEISWNYGSKWWFPGGGGDDDDSSYSITLGASRDDPSRQLVGGVAEFLIGFELQDLGSYVASNGLKSCRRKDESPSIETDIMFNTCRQISSFITF